MISQINGTIIDKKFKDESLVSLLFQMSNGIGKETTPILFELIRPDENYFIGTRPKRRSDISLGVYSLDGKPRFEGLYHSNDNIFEITDKSTSLEGKFRVYR